ncbi:MAG: feruloyl-CoA synthase [Planctomycetota bacterium]|nr:feruloyl-CoA synthase [Planctomycetota bacterium]
MLGYAKSDFAAPLVSCRRTDSAVYLDSPQSLKEHSPSISHYLSRWSEEKGEQPFLTELRSNEERISVNYKDAYKQCLSLATALLHRGLCRRKPLAILSENSIAHGLLSLAAQMVNIPVVPISPAYSLLSKNFEALLSITGQIQPGLVYAACPIRYGPALEALSEFKIQSISHDQFTELLKTSPSPEVRATNEAIAKTDLAKILFTSGSTGKPKGVLNSHGMLSSNQQAITQIWPFLEREAPVIVDWLPWHHTFGGNHNFNLVLRHGGTLHIDGGKPAPGLMAPSVKALTEISPTVYFNVPQGFAMLIPELKANPVLRASFFARLRFMFYAGASLPQHLWEELDALALAERGQKIPFVSAWGSTETAPLATAVHYPIPKAGIIGLPAPGTTIKLAAVGTKYEIRVKGPNVTEGYWQNSKSIFDEEGFYCSGDAGRLADFDNPNLGILFEGRLAEDFKLLSGTWVRVGKLRLALLSKLSVLAQDLVITGSGRGEIGLLIVPKIQACQKLAENDPVDTQDYLDSPTVLDALCDSLARYNKDHSSNSLRVGRACFLRNALSMDAGELTDKGSINQTAVLDKRKALVEALYSEYKMPGRVILERRGS